MKLPRVSVLLLALPVWLGSGGRTEPSTDATRESDATPRVDRVLEGLLRTWTADGQLVSESLYADGSPIGPSHTWLADGTLVSLRPSADGVRFSFDGDGRIRDAWLWEDGALMRAFSWDHEGSIVLDEAWPDGLEHGTVCRADHRCSQF